MNTMDFDRPLLKLRPSKNLNGFRPIIFASVLILFSIPSAAQPDSNPDSVRFANTLTFVLPAITDDEISQKFQEKWTSDWTGGGFSSGQMFTLVEMFDQLQGHPSQINVLGTIAVLARGEDNVDPSKFERLLDLCRKSLDQYSNQSGQILVSIRDFLRWNALYYSNFNKLIFKEGSYDFGFIDQEEVIEEIPQPATEESVEIIAETDSTDWAAEDSWVVDDQGFEVAFSESETEYSDYETPVNQGLMAGPIIEFENIHLVIITPFDTAQIRSTNGRFLIAENIFEGNEGKMDWSVVGLSRNSVFCKFGEYRMRVNLSQIRVEEAKLTYLGRLKDAVRGSFRFVSLNPRSENRAKYPRFLSDQAGHPIDIGNDSISLIGGVNLQGLSFSTRAKSNEPSFLHGEGSQGTTFNALATSYLIEDSIIYSSGPAEIKIEQGIDSLYHPGMRLSFYPELSHLRLIEDQSEYRHAPLTSSRFDMDLYSSLIDWDLRSDSINFSILN